MFWAAGLPCWWPLSWPFPIKNSVYAPVLVGIILESFLQCYLMTSVLLSHRYSASQCIVLFLPIFLCMPQGASCQEGELSVQRPRGGLGVRRWGGGWGGGRHPSPENF